MEEGDGAENRGVALDQRRITAQGGGRWGQMDFAPKAQQDWWGPRRRRGGARLPSLSIVIGSHGVPSRNLYDRHRPGESVKHRHASRQELYGGPLGSEVMKCPKISQTFLERSYHDLENNGVRRGGGSEREARL